jgi:hypothetical protein
MREHANLEGRKMEMQGLLLGRFFAGGGNVEQHRHL